MGKHDHKGWSAGDLLWIHDGIPSETTPSHETNIRLTNVNDNSTVWVPTFRHCVFINSMPTSGGAYCVIFDIKSLRYFHIDSKFLKKVA